LWSSKLGAMAFWVKNFQNSSKRMYAWPAPLFLSCVVEGWYYRISGFKNPIILISLALRELEK